MWKVIALCLIALTWAGCSTNGPTKPGRSPAIWVQSFELSPSDSKPTTDLLNKYPGLAHPPTLKGTVRYRFALSIGGGALRVQLFNPTDTPLWIAASSVARASDGTDTVPDSIRALKFDGQPTVYIPVNASVLSDPVSLRVDPLTELVVSLYVPHGFIASPLGGAMISWGNEDATANATLQEAKRALGRPLVSGILVAQDRPTAVIAAFGDSITDGARMQPAEPHGWADALMRRLAQQRGGLTVGVISAGIGGNRVLSPGWGPSALARVDRDVLAVPGVAFVVLPEGINDIGNADTSAETSDMTPLDAPKLIAGLAQVAERARAKGLKVYGGTILPFRGAKYFSEDKEKIRLAVNAWIRDSSAFDAIIDFDSAIKDPIRPDTMNPRYDSGDRLHPSETGYKAMAEAIPLALFESARR